MRKRNLIILVIVILILLVINGTIDLGNLFSVSVPPSTETLILDGVEPIKYFIK